MLIKYIGHACFKIRDNDTGYSIVFDPYKDGSVAGFGKIVDTASELLCSHDHDDHCGTGHIKLEPADDSPYDVKYIDTWHDPEKGALRGPNRIHIITHKATGEKLIHYGDIGEKLDDLLTDENLDLLKDADIALIPVGGVYTYDIEEALDLIERTHPKLTLPMHYRSQSMDFGLTNIDSIECFLEAAANRGHKVNVGKIWFVDTAETEIPGDILALMPQNMQPGGR